MTHYQKVTAAPNGLGGSALSRPIFPFSMDPKKIGILSLSGCEKLHMGIYGIHGEYMDVYLYMGIYVKIDG